MPRCTRPGQTILSGPAASVMGFSALRPGGRGNPGARLSAGPQRTWPSLSMAFRLLEPMGAELGGHKTLIRSLKTQSIPLGGDSTVRVENGELKIGPQREGPAMAYGGRTPTPTDALFALGKVTSGNVEAARRGIASIAAQLGKSLEETAGRIFDCACEEILRAADRMIEKINSKPVYTVRQLLGRASGEPHEHPCSGWGRHPILPQRLAAPGSIPRPGSFPRWQVANAIGAGLARNTLRSRLVRRYGAGCGNGPPKRVITNPSRRTSIGKRRWDSRGDSLKKKYLAEGAEDPDPEIEIIEDLQFHMIRGFNSAGRNIRIKVQVKPGLIPEYGQIAESLSRCDAPGDITRTTPTGQETLLIRKESTDASSERQDRPGLLPRL